MTRGQRDVEAAPERLIDGDGDVGRLLQRALTEDGESPRKSSFAALMERREIRRRRSFYGTFWVPLGAAACAAFGAWLVVPSGIADGPSFSIQSESDSLEMPSRVRAAATTADTEVLPTPEPLPTAKRMNRATRPLSESTTKERPGSPSLTCAEFARRGAFPAALACYEKQTEASGITAELAWIEKARLERRALSDSSAALATLTKYVSKYPGGALTTEAELSRLEILTAKGATDEALALVEKLLESGRADERKPELLRLRARLDEKRAASSPSNSPSSN